MVSRCLVIWNRNRYHFGLVTNMCYFREIWRKLISRPRLPPTKRIGQIRGNASRSGADATIKRFISRARIRAQWQIYRFQPSQSSSTGRILKAEGSRPSRTNRTRTEPPECTSNRTSTVYALRLQPFRFLAFLILLLFYRSFPLSPSCIALPQSLLAIVFWLSTL